MSGKEAVQPKNSSGERNRSALPEEKPPYKCSVESLTGSYPSHQLLSPKDKEGAERLSVQYCTVVLIFLITGLTLRWIVI